MKVVGRNMISAYLKVCGPTQSNDVQNWWIQANAAAWLGPADVKITFPAGQNSSGNQWEFPMPRSTAEVKVKVNYRTKTVLVTKVT